MNSSGKKKSKGGRPRFLVDEVTLAVRLSGQQAAAIRDVADNLTIKTGKRVTMSEVVRNFIREGLMSQKETAEIDLNF